MLPGYGDEHPIGAAGLRRPDGPAAQAADDADEEGDEQVEEAAAPRRAFRRQAEVTVGERVLAEDGVDEHEREADGGEQRQV